MCRTKKHLLILTILFLVGCIVSNAQTSPAVSIPQIIQPSPEASSLGKYGDFPVGMFTGHPNVTIPLDKIATKHLSVPISLNYSTNGIKVNELSSNVGMSWALNCGGVITRTVYGFPDFGLHPVAVPPSTLSFDAANPDPGTIAWMYGVATTGEDTQADAFNFNFNGYAGKFYIVPQGPANNVTYTVITAPYSNIKIQYDFTRSDWNFMITTPDGVMYYFGGSNATENIETTNNCGTGTPGLVPTAWYLNKIQHPYDISDYLLFSYVPNNYQYSTSVNQVETYWDGTGTCPQDDPVHGCSCGPSAYIYGQATATIPYEQYCKSSSQVLDLYLHSITDGKYNQVLFDYIPKTDANGGYLLSHITVNNNQTAQNIRSFSFNYQTANPISQPINTTANNYDASTNLPRPFLTEVDELDNTGAIVKPYKFSYNDFSRLPPRLSFSQDYWGFYNGQNNPSALPMSSTDYDRLLATSIIANRNPDYHYASMGLLNKVTYPTGGYTTLEYEGNTTNTSYTGATDPSNYDASYSQLQSITVNSASPNQTFTVPSPTTVTITATVSCNCPSGTGCAAESDSYAWGTLTSNLTTTVQTFDFTAFNTRQDCSKAISVSYTLQPGITYGIGILQTSSYQFTITIQAPSGSYLFVPGIRVPNSLALLNTAGGLRVKRVVSFDPIANNSIIKNYVYDALGTHFPAQPTYYHHLRHIENWFIPNPTDHVCQPTTGLITQVGYHQFSSNSFIDAFGQNSSPVYYTKVTEVMGDNYENGGIEHDFSFEAFLPMSTPLGEPVYAATAPLQEWRNGLEIGTKSFKMVSGSRVPVQSKTMSYQVDQRNSTSVNQYVIEKIGNADPTTVIGAYTPPATTQIQNYNVALLNYVSEWQYLSSDIRQDYDLNGNPTVAITTNYFYDNPSHALLTRVQTTDSKGLTVQEVKRYPQDNASISSLTSAEATAITNLITQGRIGELIEEEKDRNAVLVQRVHNSYNSISSNLVLPQSIQVQNGPSGGSYVANTFNNYDANGDILEMTPQNGMPGSYIWDYQNKFPIAKVANATPVDIAYTSFEADGTGNWTVGSTSRDGSTITVTGNKSYMLSNGSISYGSLTSSNTYTLSYWSNNGSYTISGSPSARSGRTVTLNGVPWTYYEHTITGVSSVSISTTGSGNIDELRLYPSTAFMTTYTYDPLLGITTECDAANHISYFQYDAFGRLNQVLDQDKNITKHLDYQYQHP